MQSQKKLDNEISYTRFTAHTADKQFSATLLEQLGKEDSKNIYKQLGIIFAFKDRNQAEAEKYLEEYRRDAETDLEKAEALIYLGYAKTIDPTYREETLFVAARELLSNLTSPEAQMLDILAMQYHALMLHRQAIKAESLDLDAPFLLAEQAIARQQALQKTFPLINIGLAEALHLKAIMLTRVGDARKNPQYLEQAHQLFADAAQLEEEFCKLTNHPHFLSAITLQSHAMILMKLNRSEEAMNKLNQAYIEQLAFFGTDVHADIAKTLHFKGEVAMSYNAHGEAVDYFLAALICKKQITYKDRYMIEITEKKLSETLQEMSQHSSTRQLFAVHKNIYKTLTGDMQQNFVDKDSVFVAKIQTEVERLRDIISRHDGGRYNAHGVDSHGTQDQYVSHADVAGMGEFPSTRFKI